ncbi:hypothetical protein KHQ81_06145 [Mycoplasmatota bacterium]|nr:hypothetical protein KHQ81_06145 [Mycoplasmatota bacterium]
MNCVDFLTTIYLGDRIIKKIIIDSYNNKLEIHLNRISRIRSIDGNWHFYNKEDIENGIIVINDIKNIVFDASGLFPNDEIYSIYATELDNGFYDITIEAIHADENIGCHDITIKVIGKSIHLVNPNSGEIITN